MLISRVPDETGGEGRGEPDAAEEIAHNFQTASELFELMAKDHDFEAGDDPLTTRDLVLLYKNIDLGKQLMSNVNEFKRQTPNQYVENVIYHDDAETDSDLSESYSSEDLHNIMLVNKERIDLLTNKPSLNSLCHKLGDLEIQVSNISTDYDRHFLFKDPYIKEQLKSLQLMSKANEPDSAVLPTSLLDYICCKRLEDNYNFYMDNIIKYVKNTIEQLKRISNGDYLPDRVKEKWREVEDVTANSDNASKVLTTSISIPLQVERKVTGLTTTWDDIVHSEVDLRSLVKILEKKIVLEVPKMICGTYKLFSKYQADNLVISCKRSKRAAAQRDESRVDVVVQLQRSSTGQVLSNIDSIMVLQPQQQIVQKDCTKPCILPVTYEKTEQGVKLTSKVIELSELDPHFDNKTSIESNELTSLGSLTDYRGDYESKDSSSSPKPGSPTTVAQILSSVSRVIRAEAAANHASPNELHFSMINLNRQTSLPEEGSLDSSLDYTKTRKKSPTKVRIKSPYENKSAILEERKRRRLLEVRERRERRKMAMDDNSKVSKHKALPQAVNSVTKLSITNKAFYNSIYGRNFDNAQRLSTTSFCKIKGRKEKQNKDGVIQEMEQESEGELVGRENTTSNKNIKKNNKCHFLDDTETEMSYLESRMDNGFLRISTSTSAVSNESVTNLWTLSDHSPSLTSLGQKGESQTVLEKRSSEHEVEMARTQSVLNKVPSNSPKCDSEKNMPAVECRRSLEKIYTLMKKLREIESNETTAKKTSTSNTRGILSSGSGTSLNHRLSYTNPSCTSFEKPDDQETKEGDESDQPTTVVPKVVISTKPLTEVKTDEMKKDRKAKVSRIRTIPENPLKAISQLLHEFDNVQRSRQKIADPKSINRSMSTDARNVARPELQRRRSRIEPPLAKEDPLSKVTAKVKTRFISREDMRSEAPKAHILDKKNINDLIDEAKEARGEAVRGPTKFSSRLNMLAQPKRAYVQALNEEFPRRQTPERPQRETAHAPRSRRRGGEAHSSLVSVKPPHSLERTGQPGRSAGSSPDSRVREPSQFAALAAAAASTLRPTLKKKLVAVEPSVSSHCSRGPERLETTCTPLLPSDLELLSHSSSPVKDEHSSRATSLGSKLHRLVASTLRAAPRPRSAAPRVCPESPGKHIATVLEEPFPGKHHRNGPQNDARLAVRSTVTPANSAAELEHALHRRLSCGTFPARLRIKKLTLTPKPSLQQIVMHQSGDTTSLVFESDISQKIRVTTKSSDRKTDLMALLSTTRMNCGFYGFPLQISTVGYAFPTFQGEMKMKPKIVGKDLLKTADAETMYTVSRKPSRVTAVVEITDEEETTRRYFVGRPTSPGTESAVQVTGLDLLAAATTILADEVCAPRKNVETNTTDRSILMSDSSDTVGTQDIELTTRVTGENYELSDYTTSLDMLVELLNEIQKITISAGDASASSGQTLDSGPREPRAAGPGAARAALDELESDCFSLFVDNTNVTSDDQIEIFIPKTISVGVGAEAEECKPVCEDKEVWARVPAPQQHATVNTDPPSDPEPAERLGPLFPHDAGTCTMNMLTSSCFISTVTTSEYYDVASDTSIKPDDKINEQTGINRNSVKSLVPFYDSMFKVENTKKETVVTCENMVQCTVSKRNSFATCDILVNIVPVGTSENVLLKCDEVQVQNTKKDVSKHCLNDGDFDSTLKMKRDVLVTFYSILVLTVFAALALPEMQFLQQA